jgi:hypothetical protein
MDERVRSAHALGALPGESGVATTVYGPADGRVSGTTASAAPDPSARIAKLV